MANIIAWPPTATEYPGVSGFRVHAETVRDMVFDRSAEKTPWINTLREGERVPNKVFYHMCDGLESVSDPTFFTRASSGANSDWSRTTGVTTHGQGRGVTYRKRIPFTQFTQNFREEMEVHNDNDYMKAFGVAREYAYQVVKKSKRLGIMKEMRNWEDVFYPSDSREPAGGGGVEHIGTDSTDPVLTRPLIEQLVLHSEAGRFNYSGNIFRAEDMARVWNNTTSHTTLLGAAATKANGNLPTVQIRINEDLITKILETTTGNAQDPEAMPDLLWTSVSPYSHLGGLGSVTSPTGNLGALTLTQASALEAIKRAIRSYESQLGPVAFGNSRWILQANNLGTANGITRPTSPITGRTGASPLGNPGYLWGFQTDMLENRTFRPFMHKALPEQGDSAIGYVHGEDGAELLHPLSGMVVIGLNNV